MVKDAASNIWLSLPLNLGSRLADLTEWTEQGSSALSSVSSGSSSLLVGATAATLGAMGLWYWTSRPTSGKITPLVNPDMQTRELQDGSRICNYLKSDVLMRHCHEDVKTVFDAIRRGQRVSANGPMLGHRESGDGPYRWITYGEVIDRSVRVAKAMRAMGQAPGQDSFIGIYSKNRAEWIMVEQATYAFSNVLVPLYETLGADASVHIINQTNIQLVFCDTEQKASTLLERKDVCPSLLHIVLFVSELADELRQKAAQVGVQLYTFEEFEQLSENSEVSDLALMPPKPEDLATICYTSGTTGVPKGVMLTHGNVIADVTTLVYLKTIDLGPKDVMISFLPLAHMFERVMQTGVYSEGGSVGFFRGDVRFLVDDIQALRPTVMPVVPRVLNRVYDKVMADVNKSSVKKMLFDGAMKLKSRELKNWIVRNDSIVDKLVFKKIRERFGGRVRLMITGSAPCSETVLNFVRAALGCIVCEGYGQTECVAAATLTIEGDYVPGHVGVPSPCNAIKLVDAPELNYFAKDHTGEICIKGTNVFRGYYKMPEQTREVLDADGWLHTGDIGKWTERGTLKIIDRKKHIFKLAQGEYVAPEKIENIYTHSKFVAQCFIHGESLKTCLVGVIVPDPEVLPSAIKALLGWNGKPFAEMCKDPAVKKAILEDLHAIGKKAGLFSFEQVQDVYVCPEMFTIENDLLTPTMKSKRPQLRKHFARQIDEMYQNLS